MTMTTAGLLASEEWRNNNNTDVIGSVIWLHGLGANGHDFVPVLPQLALPTALSLRFVLPHAPNMPVGINGGMPMPAWYDIKKQTSDGRFIHDTSSLQCSIQHIHALIDHELQLGIAAKNIILVGFSQGGAMALHIGLSYKHALAGIVALSCYLLDDKVVWRTDVSVWMAHGSYDNVVAPRFGNRSRAQLQQAGVPLIWQTYPMAHSVCVEELHDLGQWITTVQTLSIKK